MTARPRGLCTTCGNRFRLVRLPGALWPDEPELIADHKSPSPVFGPITRRCPGALKRPWGAPPPPAPQLPGQTSILETP